MSDDWEIPRVRVGQKLRRGDSPVLAGTPEPLASQSTADLRGTITSEAVAWAAAAAHLSRAEAWFRSHDVHNTRWNACAARSAAWTSAAFRARLSAGHAVLAYTARCQTLEGDALRREQALFHPTDPTDAYTIWVAHYPCPHAMNTVAHMVKGWRMWWHERLGRDPPPCREDPTTCWRVCLPGGREEMRSKQMRLENE